MKNKINQYETIFITATNTDVGKTYACKKFLNYFARFWIFYKTFSYKKGFSRLY